MFRRITNSAPCKQPLQKVEKLSKKDIKGGTMIQRSVTFENPQKRIDFDKYSLEDLMNTGVKLEQVNTKVIENTNFDAVSNVPRETQEQETQEQEPF